MMLLAAAPAAAVHSVSKSTAAVRAELGRDALAALAAAASDPDPEARADAARAWGRLGNRATIPMLKRALQDENPDVRAAAAVSLRRLGDVQGLTALIDEIKPRVYGAASGPAEELRRMARDAARSRAVLLLAESAGEAGAEALESALADPSGVVRDAAAAALARRGRIELAAPFLAALKDRDEGVRAAAARNLGLAGGGIGGESLRALAASDASESVRAEALLALGGASGAASLDALAAALKDKSGRVRLAAVRALARREEPGSTAALKALLEKAPAPEPALTAAAALASRGEEADLSLAELTLGQKDPELKVLAVAVLAASSKPAALDLLAKALREDPSARVRAQAAAGAIARLRRVEEKR